MVFDYENNFKKKNISPYERLLIDAMKGDQTLFARQDGVEAMWDIVDPIIKFWDMKKGEDNQFYKAGSWGPQASDDLLKKDGRRWRLF
jgi:glucose-6-phosphate 1-dehydrogenase